MQDSIFYEGSRYFYPLVSKEKFGFDFSRCFLIGGKGQLLSSFDLNEEEIRRELKIIEEDYYLTGKGKIPVLSHERLSGNPHSSCFDASVIASRLHCVFSSSKIFICIRKQSDIIFSTYYQYLKAGGTMKLSRYLKFTYDGKRPFFSINSFEYFLMVKRYYELFGMKNVLVLPYELFVESPQLFLAELQNFAGFFSMEEVDSSEIKNRSSNYFLRSFFRWANLFRVKTSLNNYSVCGNRIGFFFLTTLFETIISRSNLSYLDNYIENKNRKLIVEFVGNQFVNDNKKLGELIGIDLGKYGYYK